MTDGPAPYKRDLSVPCGADFVMTVALVDATSGAAIPLGTPRMDVRDQAFFGGRLTVAPTVTVTGNQATITIPGSATKTLQGGRGYYDLFVTRTDTGQEVKLAYGQVNFYAAVTQL